MTAGPKRSGSHSHSLSDFDIAFVQNCSFKSVRPFPLPYQRILIPPVFLPHHCGIQDRVSVRLHRLVLPYRNRQGARRLPTMNH